LPKKGLNLLFFSLFLSKKWHSKPYVSRLWRSTPLFADICANSAEAPGKKSVNDITVCAYLAYPFLAGVFDGTYFVNANGICILINYSFNLAFQPFWFCLRYHTIKYEVSDMMVLWILCNKSCKF